MPRLRRTRWLAALAVCAAVGVLAGPRLLGNHHRADGVPSLFGFGKPPMALVTSLPRSAVSREVGTVLQYQLVDPNHTRSFGPEPRVVWPSRHLARLVHRARFEIETTLVPQSVQLLLYDGVANDGTPSGSAQTLTCGAPEGTRPCAAGHMGGQWWTWTVGVPCSGGGIYHGVLYSRWFGHQSSPALAPPIYDASWGFVLRCE